MRVLITAERLPGEAVQQQWGAARPAGMPGQRPGGMPGPGMPGAMAAAMPAAQALQNKPSVTPEQIPVGLMAQLMRMVSRRNKEMVPDELNAKVDEMLAAVQNAEEDAAARARL